MKPTPSDDTRFQIDQASNRRFLPFLCGCGMAASLFWSAHVWRGHGLWPTSGLVLAGLLILGYYFLISRLFSWTELIREEEMVVLKAGKLPYGLAPRFLLQAFPPIRDGCLRIPLESLRMEWLGNRLLFHGHPLGDVCVGGGTAAQRAADWLRGQGVPEPTGPPPVPR